MPAGRTRPKSAAKHSSGMASPPSWHPWTAPAKTSTPAWRDAPRPPCPVIIIFSTPECSESRSLRPLRNVHYSTRPRATSNSDTATNTRRGNIVKTVAIQMCPPSASHVQFATGQSTSEMIAVLWICPWLRFSLATRRLLAGVWHLTIRLRQASERSWRRTPEHAWQTPGALRLNCAMALRPDGKGQASFISTGAISNHLITSDLCRRNHLITSDLCRRNHLITSD